MARETIVVRNALTHRLMIIRVVRLRRRRRPPCDWLTLIKAATLGSAIDVIRVLEGV